MSEMFVIRKSLSMNVIHFVSGEMMRNASSTPRTTKKTRSGFLSAPKMSSPVFGQRVNSLRMIAPMSSVSFFDSSARRRKTRSPRMICGHFSPHDAKNATISCQSSVIKILLYINGFFSKLSHYLYHRP